MAIQRIPEEELGAGALMTSERVRHALGLVKEGHVYDLDAGRYGGQARHYAHPPLDVVTYRTPRGERNQADLAYLRPDVNRVGYGFVSELVIGTVHTGCHIDALSHVVRGDNSEWFGGFSANEYVGDQGVLKCDVTSIPPLLTRGVFIDVAKQKGVDVLPESYAITISDIRAACTEQDAHFGEGDALVIRTGQMQSWPSGVRSFDKEAGIDLECAKWLADHHPLLIASDSSAIEVAPSSVDGSPQPVHIELIAEHGIYMVKWLYTEELSRDGVRYFLLVCLPVKIRGATGSMVRPIAIV